MTRSILVGLALLVVGCSSSSGGTTGTGEEHRCDAGETQLALDGSVCTGDCVRVCAGFCGVGSPDAYAPCATVYSVEYCATHDH